MVKIDLTKNEIKTLISGLNILYEYNLGLNCLKLLKKLEDVKK